jgi:hypothetical protein
MRPCAACGGSVGSEYRFCPWCAAPLRLKLVEFFEGHAEISADRALRVSRYYGEEPHVRFSVWADSENRARAECAVSLDEDEAARLAHFLVGTAPRERRPGLLERLYSSLAR